MKRPSAAADGHGLDSRVPAPRASQLDTLNEQLFTIETAQRFPPLLSRNGTSLTRSPAQTYIHLTWLMFLPIGI
jgi:hypothetical protein